MTKARIAKALGVLLLLFAGVYGPAFLAVALLKLRPVEAVPVVIVISLATAVVLIHAISGSAEGFGHFGFRTCRPRYIAAAIALGVPIGWAVTILTGRLGPGSSLPGMSFRPWVTLLYFVVGASIQEEVIFRGLLQSYLARQIPATLSFFGFSFSWPAIIVAVMFGVIHWRVSPITAVGAFVLGLLAGELRHRSDSLVPAIFTHAIFNLFSLLAAVKWLGR